MALTLDRCALFLSLIIVRANAANWAVIVAGSKGYFNYRHQSDACHAYHIVKAKGIPEDNIIMMAYDDVADDDENPFKGKLFNRPSTGSGNDVYKGCKIDYRSKQVTAKQFIDVITGTASGKVLKSTADDNVFINFVDHGAPGLIAFPETELHKTELQKALKQMSEQKMFKKLVFYLESCESGSMFEGMKIPGVYALSAANGKESSYGTYCSGKQAEVDGKSMHTCLGDLFSVNWMQDIDAQSGSAETLEQQFKKVKRLTNKSHVMQWGDLSFSSDSIDSFRGPTKLNSLFLPRTTVDPLETALSAREVDLFRLYDAYSSTNSSTTRLQRAMRLQVELQAQAAVERVHLQIVADAYPGDVGKQQQVRRYYAKPNFPECELEAHTAIREHCADQFDANSGFALQFHQLVVNICEDIAMGLNFDLKGSAAQACKKPSAAIVV
jgi:legumain